MESSLEHTAESGPKVKRIANGHWGPFEESNSFCTEFYTQRKKSEAKFTSDINSGESYMSGVNWSKKMSVSDKAM